MPLVGSFYPAPPWPVWTYPYIFLGYMIVGGALIFAQSRRHVGILAEIEADLETTPLDIVAEGIRSPSVVSADAVSADVLSADVLSADVLSADVLSADVLDVDTEVAATNSAPSVPQVVDVTDLPAAPTDLPRRRPTSPAVDCGSRPHQPTPRRSQDDRNQPTGSHRYPVRPRTASSTCVCALVRPSTTSPPGCEVGMSEEDAKAMARDLLAEREMKRGWHHIIVRCGPNTTKDFMARSEPGVVLQPNDIFFVDIGPVHGDFEGDGGDTFVFGSDPEHHQAKPTPRTSGRTYVPSGLDRERPVGSCTSSPVRPPSPEAGSSTWICPATACPSTRTRPTTTAPWLRSTSALARRCGSSRSPSSIRPGHSERSTRTCCWRTSPSDRQRSPRGC